MHVYQPDLSGKVQSSRLDVRSLGLVPLGLQPRGDGDPAAVSWGQEREQLRDLAASIVARGRRSAFEVERVVPGADSGGWDADPIAAASRLLGDGDRGAAEDVLMKVLAEDLRCIDAHAHLGDAAFDHWPKQAMRHYMVGAGIGALTLGVDFDGVLPWELNGNRPLLKSLHGLGKCFWRVGESKEATATFRRLLWLNPANEGGVRFDLADVEGGQAWEECDGP